MEQPEKFEPERWLKTENAICPVHQNKIHPYVSLPFGYGRRSCLGRRLAETELNILLAKVIDFKNWVYIEDRVDFINIHQNFIYLQNVKETLLILKEMYSTGKIKLSPLSYITAICLYILFLYLLRKRFIFSLTSSSNPYLLLLIWGTGNHH